MSSLLPPQLGDTGAPLPPRIDGGLDAPALPPHNLTGTTQFNPGQTSFKSLDEMAMGRASMILDQVRNRQMSWQDAQGLLKTLSNDDKQTIAKFRGNMNEDERRALGMSKGGGGLLGKLGGIAEDAALLGPNLIGAGGVAHDIGNTVGNLASDIGMTVRTAPAGIAKIAMAGEHDVMATLRDPLGWHPHRSAVLNDIIKPMLHQYGYTYGPLFEGDPSTTLSRLNDHPLQPIMDAFAVASMGLGTAGRVAAATRALDATKLTRAADGSLRMGVDAARTTARYKPLGYSMEHYVRPTAEQMANEPYMNHFSVLIDTKTGDSLFSPVGSSHDEIYDPLFDNRGTATRDRWDNPEKHPVIQATGVFDPETGKVASINIDPEDMAMAAGTNVPKLINKVKADAEKTYITPQKLRSMTPDNPAGNLIIRAGNPRPGEPQLWYIMKPNGQRVASNFPNEGAAIAHAQSLVTGGVTAPALEKSFVDWTQPDTGAARQMLVRGANLTPKSQFQVAREAYFQRSRGSLMDAYEKARGITHDTEYENIANEIVNNVLDNQDLPIGRSKSEAVKAALSQAAEDFVTTYHKDVGAIKGQAAEQPEFIAPGTAAALKAVGISIREASDLIRAGAVFLRPAYIPNNWAGNAFLNTIHQGVFAPLELGKSLVMDKHIGTRYTRGIDQAMGFNAAQLVSGRRGAGYIASAVDPVAHLMGSIADQPFRRAAWLHEARRAGYKTLADVKALWDKADAEKEAFLNRGGVGKGLEDGSWDQRTTPALAEIAKISRSAQEEIIKFGKYNDIESGLLRNLIFVYSWMRGAGRYFARFPMVHPMQAAVSTSVAAIGQNWLNQTMGGVPAFMIGAIPVGKDSNGNTMVINPFTVNPLGSGAQMLGTAVSLKKILSDPSSFNKYVDQDPAQLFNPLVASTIEAYTGGRPMSETIPKSIAAYRLYQNLEHPGRGQIYPTSRLEAIGQFTGGSMFPRMTSQAGITRALERERADMPAMRIDDEMKLMKDKLNFTPPKFLVDNYKADLQKLAQEKDFQHSYAQAHGSQGFTNMPAANRAEAAVEYLSRYHLVSPVQLEQMQQQMDTTKDDTTMNALANAFWNLTGSGIVKQMWQQMVKTARDRNLTAKRP